MAKNSKVRFRPLGDCVLIAPEPEEEYIKYKEFKHVVVPDAYKHGPEDRPKWGKVLRMGSKCAKREVKLGDRVLYAKFGWAKLNYGKDKFYAIVREEDILAVDTAS